MQKNINISTLSLNSYLEKQKCFIALVRNIQYSLQTKEYKQFNYSIDEFIRMRWNISKAQAYRYLISAKVLDQLEEFEIQPCYERICRALYNCAKTPKQMKLLWSAILKSAGNRPDSINSSHIKKMWKKLCDDKKYSKICHYEDEIINKVEMSLKQSKEEKNESTSESESDNEHMLKEKNQSPLFTSSTVINNNIPQYTFYPSPVISESVIPSNYAYCNIISPQSSCESLVCLNENVQYTTSSSPLNINSSNLIDETNVNQLNSNYSLYIPTLNTFEFPVVSIPCSTQAEIIEQSQQQPQQILFYY